jgi:hypothetical protein
MLHKILSVVFFLNGALAMAEGAKDDKFAEHKQKALTEIDERLQKLNEHKACVSAATNVAALEECHKKMQEFRFGERMEHMQNRKERIDERMKKAQEKHQDGH